VRLNNVVQAVPDRLLQDLIGDQVEHQPDAAAIITSQGQLTYRELFARANQVAHALCDLGIQPNQLVPVVMEKGWEQIVAVIGIIMAGAAYVPLEAQSPVDRLAYVLDNSESQLVLTQSWLQPTLDLPSNLAIIAVDQDLKTQSTAPLPPIQCADDLAYVIYTSGSTGTPKGVMVSHRNLVNTIVTTNQRFRIRPQDRMLALTALNHDMAVYDIFGLLSAGGALVLPDAARVKDAEHWLGLMQQKGVTLWNSVPAMMGMLTTVVQGRGSAQAPDLRLVFMGGDWIPLTLPEQIRSWLSPTTQIFSVGGPTETSVWNICYAIEQVDPHWQSIPYGQPMANSKYHIFNDSLQNCPTWVTGEMYAAGVQVAQGYWRNPEKTEASFLRHPHTGERIYRTGDRGRYLPDGTIEFMGRADFQIKLRGYRIEPGEIEAALTRHQGVQSAVVVSVGQNQNQVLAAYIVPEPGQKEPTVEGLMTFLKPLVPDYMIPANYIFLDTLPLSANGKVDRKSLISRSHEIRTLEVAYAAPASQLEEQITIIWKQVLNLEKISTYENFFDLGGNSLLITQVYSRLKEEIPDKFQSVSVVELFKYPTIYALANRLESSQEKIQIDLEGNLKQKTEQGRNRLKQRSRKLSKV
jgi:amino acid adenylation domain-containing protein